MPAHLSMKMIIRRLNNCPTIRNLYIRECYPCEYTNNVTVKEFTFSVTKGVEQEILSISKMSHLASITR